MSPSEQTVILNFHGVGDVGAAPRALEPGEAEYWITADFFAAIIARIAATARPGPAVEITFDDGNISDLEICAPALAGHGLTASFFPLAGRLGTPGSLSPADLRALRGLGMNIGSHGHGHVDWRRLSESARSQELVAARVAIAGACGGAVESAAIPFGTYNRAVLSQLRTAGYRRVYTSDGGLAGPGWLQPRTSVHRTMDMARIEHILSGSEPHLRHLRRRLAKLKKRLL